MRKALLASIICAFFLPFATEAAKPTRTPQPRPPSSSLVPVPENMQQRWILPDCAQGQVAYRFSDHFLLVSTSAGSKLRRIGGLRDDGNDRYSMVTPAETVGLVIGSKGQLIQYYGDTPASFSVEALEKKKIMVAHIMFQNCTNDGPMIIQENSALVSLLPHLDRIHKACPETKDISKAACRQSIFTLFDKNEDSALEQSEMAEAWKIIVPASSFSACSVNDDGTNLLNADGSEYFTWIFSHLDKDADKEITFDEIDGQWLTLQSDPLMSGALNFLIAAQGPLEILPADFKMTCPNCCIAISKPQ